MRYLRLRKSAKGVEAAMSPSPFRVLTLREILSRRRAPIRNYLHSKFTADR